MDLSGRESLDDYHGSATVGTEPIGARVLGRGCWGLGLHGCGVEGCKAQRQKLSSAATGEEAGVADAYKALGEQMQQEAA